MDTTMLQPARGGRKFVGGEVMYLGEALFYPESHPRIPHSPQIVLYTHRMAPLRNSCLTFEVSRKVQLAALCRLD